MGTDLVIEGDPLGEAFDFTLRHDGGTVPATFWNARTPRGGGTPLTLIQHGGPFHARHDRAAWLARAVVSRTDSAVLMIDGPIHGRRRDDDPAPEKMLGAFKAHWQASPGIDDMVADWSRALDAVIDQGWADPARIAWLGVSMGTAYGVPLCATDPRFAAAVFGMWGTDWGHEDIMLAHARRIRSPVLFQIKTEDAFFSNAGQRKIFDALGSLDKALKTYEGGHDLTAPGQLDDILGFINRALGGNETAA